MNLQQYFPLSFFENPAIDATMYSENFLQLKKNSLQEKFCEAAFLIRNIYMFKKSVFDFKWLQYL